MSNEQPPPREAAPDALSEALAEAAAAGRAPAADPLGAAGVGGHAAARDAAREAAHDAVDWWTERLLDAAELESAVADALAADHEAPRALRRLSVAAARGLAGAQAAARGAVADEARARDRLAAAAHVAAVAVRDALAGGALGAVVTVEVSAGYAARGLFPAMYAAAARRFAGRVGPPRALVVGVRGAAASAVVADALARRGVDVRSVTARPNAGPDAALDAAVSAHAAAPGAWVAIVGEAADVDAPALDAVAAAAAGRGIDASRVVLFPGWPNASSAAQDAPTSASLGTSSHRRFAASFEDAVLARGLVRCHRHEPDCRLERVEGGALVFRCRSDHGGDGPVRLAFAGLGRHGRERAAAAARRAEAGEGPRVLGLRHGFLVTADG